MEPKARIVCFDAFRGFAILGMVLINYLAGIRWIPGAFKHAPDIGLTAADLIAPLFIFAIGLTYGPSFERGVQRDGFGKTAGRFAGRYLAILGVGALIRAGEPLTGETGKLGSAAGHRRRGHRVHRLYPHKAVNPARGRAGAADRVSACA